MIGGWLCRIGGCGGVRTMEEGSCCDWFVKGTGDGAGVLVGQDVEGGR